MKIHRAIPVVALATAIGAAAFLTSCSSDDSGPPNSPPVGPTFASGDLGTNEIFVRTFTEAGSWDYRCSLHSGMDGVVNVSPAGVDSPVVEAQSGNVFNPPSVTVKTGSYVKWVNTDAGMPHNVTRPKPPAGPTRAGRVVPAAARARAVARLPQFHPPGGHRQSGRRPKTLGNTALGKLPRSVARRLLNERHGHQAPRRTRCMEGVFDDPLQQA